LGISCIHSDFEKVAMIDDVDDSFSIVSTTGSAFQFQSIPTVLTLLYDLILIQHENSNPLAHSNRKRSNPSVLLRCAIAVQAPFCLKCSFAAETWRATKSMTIIESKSHHEHLPNK
jgi:hypothetical protein